MEFYEKEGHRKGERNYKEPTTLCAQCGKNRETRNAWNRAYYQKNREAILASKKSAGKDKGEVK